MDKQPDENGANGNGNGNGNGSHATILSPPVDRALVILYGSQTGCAQDVAERIGREARRRHFRARVVAMDEYDKAQLIHEKLALFICSTTGQGDEPDNMKKFWKFLLRKNLPLDILSQMEYAVFGLGDSSYVKFNYPAKKLYKRLSQLGARSLVPRGDADDQHYLGVDGTLDPWLGSLWVAILERHPLPSGLSIIPADTLFPPSFRLRFLREEDRGTVMEKEIEDGFTVRVMRNERVTAEDHFQDVRHVELEVVEGGNVSYNPGDVVVLRPHNLLIDVNNLLASLGWSDIANDPFVIEPTQQDRTLPTHWPRVLTLRRLFEDHLDVFSVPRRSFFEVLAFFTNDPQQTEKLREFASPEGQDDMYAYCQRVRRTLAEVLSDFSSARIPLDYLLDLVPELRPRQFSIASAAQVHPDQIHLCVAIVKYKTMMRRIRRGVCTKWLAMLKPGDKICHVKIARGTMRPPSSPTTPLIMIGPGTGVAPMRGILESRIHEGATDNVLFFGCRYRDKDYLYADEWAARTAEGCLTVFTAFSRDQDHKVYVQDRILENAVLVWRLIDERGAVVLLCGTSTKMPEQVAYALKRVFMIEGGLDAAEAEQYYAGMEKSGRMQTETWS